MQGRGGIFGVLGRNFGAKKARKFIPLPYLKSPELLGACEACSAPCADVCQTRIILKRREFAELNFMIGKCVFCKECAIACEKIHSDEFFSQFSQSCADCAPCKDSENPKNLPKSTKSQTPKIPAPLDSSLPNKISARVKINELECLAWGKVECRMCLDNCDYGAIDFSSKLYPQINANCTACGACYGKCPKFCIEINANF